MGPSYKSKINQKRGMGTKGEYIPWIKVHEFSSKGNSSRPLGLKTKRPHHFLSNLESHFFYVLDLHPRVIDIREQFPLLDLSLIEAIYTQAGIRYPNHSKDEPHILTTDFLIDFDDGKQLAIAIKPLKAITPRQLELFEIERRYWEANDIKWKLATEADLPSKNYSLNCKDLHGRLRDFLKKEIEDDLLFEIKCKILDLYGEYPDLVLAKFSSKIDEELTIDPGTTLKFIKCLIAKGYISTDLEIPLAKGLVKTKDLKLNFSYETIIRKSDLAA